MARGFTLVELLAALMVSAFIAVMAARIFHSGNVQFMRRVSDSERLAALFKLKAKLQTELKEEVSRCSFGRLWLRRGAEETELTVRLRERIPDLLSADFRCFETASDSASLVEWTDRFQPRLVEYRMVLKKGPDTDTLAGSWIK